MKANAPEKIYIVDATFPDYVDFDGSPINTKKIDDHDIEYTRTDAFIEKACDYISNNIDRYCYIGLSGDGNGDSLTNEAYISSKFIKDFRKYMGGGSEL